jgi:hypothetical protein
MAHSVDGECLVEDNIFVEYFENTLAGNAFRLHFDLEYYYVFFPRNA